MTVVRASLAGLPVATPVTQVMDELDWVEPFVTGKPQLLHFEIPSWTVASTATNHRFGCTSPKARGETKTSWKEFHAIRRRFEVKSQPEY